MFCWKCGQPLMANEKYCPKCNANQNIGERGEKEGMLKRLMEVLLDRVKEEAVSGLTEAASKGVMKVGRAIKKSMKKKR